MDNNEAITLLQDAADRADAMLEMAHLAPTDTRAIVRLLKKQDTEIRQLRLALEEQKPGEWIYGEDETGADGWRCSECGFFEPWFYEFTDDIDFIKFYGFCPCCGRKMTSYTGKSAQECR